MALFRRILFWIHLVVGIVAGLVIVVLTFTGAAQAFEKEITAWDQRDVLRVSPPSDGASRLTIDEIVKRARAAQPSAQLGGITITSDPKDAIALTLGRDTYYANPYTGELRQASSPRIRQFVRTMNAWHRWLTFSGVDRNTGKAITGACSAALLFLTITGFYLWWPRSWSWRNLRAILLFDFKASGKARDYNWHNVVGLWAAAVLFVLTATALPLSYRWASNWLDRIGGGQTGGPGSGGGGPNATGSGAAVTKPSADAQPLGYDALLAAVQKESPGWSEVSFRLGNGGGRGGRGGGPGGPGGGGPGGGTMRGNGGENRDASRPAATTPAAAAPAASVPAASAPQATTTATPQAVSVSVLDSGTWPRTSPATLALDPYTGAVLRRETFSDQSVGRRVRMWTRYLHTGEALGRIGQIVAGIACLGAILLVWTGFALAWRRFFCRRQDPPKAPGSSK